MTSHPTLLSHRLMTRVDAMSPPFAISLFDCSLETYHRPVFQRLPKLRRTHLRCAGARQCFSAPYAGFSRRGFNAPPQAMTWSNIALTDFSCREAGLKTL